MLDPDKIKTFYKQYEEKLLAARSIIKKPLTLAEKIIFAHSLGRQDKTVSLAIDRVAMQDATAQMALLQFMNTGKQTTAVPTTIHCDHLIQAFSGAQEDLKQAVLENDEVYRFLRSAAHRYDIGFWKPGSGIIHQVILENYAVPGQLMIGTDSHTPNAGGLGMLAIGVGGTDAVDVMAGQPWEMTMPKKIGIHLKGTLCGWTSPKDIILKVAEILTVKGGTGYIIEYFGEGLKSISATGRATITNMGAEVGATTSIFPYDEKTADYLAVTGRAFVADLTHEIQENLRADQEVLNNPLLFFDEFIEIDLSALEPQIVGPHTPDLGRSISKMGEDARQDGWPLELSGCLIGSCTNSSYEDLSKSYDVVRQAYEHGLKAKVPFLITPGSDWIYQTIKQEGWLNVFEAVGGKVLANACGPCIGQWKRVGFDGQKNSIITSFNRNFKKRNDANPQTHAFIGSPEIVTALAFAGRLDFNPMRDSLGSFQFSPPKKKELPDHFISHGTGYEELSGEGEVSGEGKVSGEGEVNINPGSDRLSLLEPFTAWIIPDDFKGLFVLVKAKGKCTTDHISPAGKWLRYRGHLDNISDNMFSGAVNAFNNMAGEGKNQLSGNIQEFSKIAREYKAKGRGWVVIGDENYGEGSSREHAAMEPRYLGCRAVIAKSFARIAEVNLKRQGILPLWFVHSADYDLIREDDVLDIPDLTLDGKVYLQVQHADGSIDTIITRHTFSDREKRWFAAGSALEWLRTS